MKWRWRVGALLPAALLWLAAVFSTPCRAAALQFCDHQRLLTAEQNDILLRFASVVKGELEASGQRLALVARSGLDLARFNHRYSHAGLSLKASPNTPWSVRQLYFACDEGQPRIFDEGLPGFVLGTNDPGVGYVSLVFFPETEASLLEARALDNRRALQLLGAAYSANAHAWSVRYQNCNQWLAELLASAWGEPTSPTDPGIETAPNARSAAQRWLKSNGYAPSIFDVGFRPIIWLSAALPWLHNDDHPSEDLDQAIYRVSMPASIEAFVHASLPQATRVELCHKGRHIVIRRGWDQIAEGCVAGPADTVMQLD